jgi:tRNA-splicing ligase RtcB (3'-phosphate/5'-hydroxy nucleic acid ligase)
MAEPVLVVRGKVAGHALGFAPHGASRTFLRTEHKRRMGSVTPDQMLVAETQGLSGFMRVPSMRRNFAPATRKPTR